MDTTRLYFLEALGSIPKWGISFILIFFLHDPMVQDAPPRAGRVSLAPLPPRVDGRGVVATTYDALVDATRASRRLGGPKAT